MIFAQNVNSEKESKKYSLKIKFYNKTMYYPENPESNPIFIQVSIKNTSNETLRFKLADDRAFSLDFNVYTIQNKKLEETEKLKIKRTSDQTVYFREIALETGEEYSFVENVITDYKAALADSEVEAVFVLTPNHAHYEISMAALKAGKHVMCEKPLVLHKEEAEEVYELAAKKGLILFECIKTAYAPGFQQLLGIAGSGIIGSIRNVEACFTKLEKENTREFQL